MLCIIAPEYESRDAETRNRSADEDASTAESESGEATDEDPTDGEFLTVRPV